MSDFEFENGCKYSTVEYTEKRKHPVEMLALAGGFEKNEEMCLLKKAGSRTVDTIIFYAGPNMTDGQIWLRKGTPRSFYNENRDCKVVKISPDKQSLVFDLADIVFSDDISFLAKSPKAPVLPGEDGFLKVYATLLHYSNFNQKK
jgi:hypothetical protein